MIFLWSFPAYAKNGPRWAQMGPGGFFPTNPDLADILGRTDFDFEIFLLFELLGSQISGFPGPQISRNLALAELNRGLVANWPEEPSGPKNVNFLS